MAILSLSQLRLSFGGHALLDGVSLQIEAGERLGLLGRNGAGKSTLMRILAGMYPPDGGRVEVNGKDVTKQLDYRDPTTVDKVLAG